MYSLPAYPPMKDAYLVLFGKGAGFNTNEVMSIGTPMIAQTEAPSALIRVDLIE